MKFVSGYICVAVFTLFSWGVQAQQNTVSVLQSIPGTEWSWLIFEKPDGTDHLFMLQSEGDGAVYTVRGCAGPAAEAVALPGAEGAVVALRCNNPALIFFNPVYDWAQPVISLAGETFADYAVTSEGLNITYDVTVEGEVIERTVIWPENLEERAREQGLVAGESPLLMASPRQTGWSVGQLRFLSRLQTIVRDKDLVALRDILDENILNSFGGDGGIAEFFEQWNLNQSPEKSEVWSVLDRLLEIGGTPDFDDGNRTITLPFTFTDFPADRDPFQDMIVIGRDVPLRWVSSNTGGVKALLSYEIVTPLVGYEIIDARPDYVPVMRNTGETGYVRTDLLISPIDWRARFVEGPEGWKMTILVAGD